jgi:hypothetical protein
VLAVLLFGAHAMIRWWGAALVWVLFGDIPDQRAHSNRKIRFRFKVELFQ